MVNLELNLKNFGQILLGFTNGFRVLDYLIYPIFIYTLFYGVWAVLN